MSWESRYLPPDPRLWVGRADVPSHSCFFQCIQLVNLLEAMPAKRARSAFAILGFKCDEGVQRDLGRAGAVDGPAAICARLANLPVQIADVDFFDIGSIICTDHDLEASQAALAFVVQAVLQQGVTPIVIGGGHELALGHYQGIAQQLPTSKRLGIVNFDAHFDLHPLSSTGSGSATTAFYQIAKAHEREHRHFDYNCIGIQHAGNIRQMFDIAKTWRVKSILADDLHQGQQEKCVDFVDRVIDESDAIYMSLSLDVFAPAFAPGVSTIQPLGLNPWHVIPLLRQMAASGKVISYDIAEHVPRYDLDHRTAKLAATLVYDIIHHHHTPLA